MSVLPEIPHADVKLNEKNMIEIKMEKGWYFYIGDIFPEDTPIEEIPKGIGGTFSIDTDFSVFVVKPLTDVTDSTGDLYECSRAC